MENEVQKKRILSGIQPSGDLTLGSYLGAIRNWAALADEYDCYYMHGRHAHHHRAAGPGGPAAPHPGRSWRPYIACGLDPEKNMLFVQSHVPAHAAAGLGAELLHHVRRAEPHDPVQGQVRQARGQHQRGPVHLSRADGGGYPALSGGPGARWAATRSSTWRSAADIATRFNGLYGETFKLPDPYIPQVGARIMSLTSPTSKMSKSDKDQNGCVYMLEKPEDILRKFKKAVTDSDACVRFDPENKPGVSNLMQIYSVATGKTYRGDRGRSLPARATATSRPPWASPWWSCCAPSGRRRNACWLTRPIWRACTAPVRRRLPM